MKILNIEAHESLSYDQVNIWTELGHKVCSTGFFLDPVNPLTNVRPSTKNNPTEWFIQEFRRLNPTYKVPSMEPMSGVCNLSLELLNKFDVVIIDYYPWVLTLNEEALKKTTAKIIIRTIGFGNEYQEQFYIHAKKYRPDIKIVRMSERERICDLYAGEDAVITQCYDPAMYPEYNGSKRRILTINKMFNKRADSCEFWKYMEVMQPFENERYLVGFGNEDLDFSHDLPFNELGQAIADSQVYFSTCSKPAGCITMAFLEAYCGGLPVVSFGNQIGSWNGKNTFGIDKYLENGVTGYYSDSIPELQSYLKQLLENKELCNKIGYAGRQKGLSIFHKDIIKSQWKNVLESL